MRPADLRDAELETLIKAALHSAEQVEVQSEVEAVRGDRSSFRSAVITDAGTLTELASLFRVGEDRAATRYDQYPGMDYVRVTFTGPYKPDFQYTGNGSIYIYPNRRAQVCEAFSRRLADTAGITYQPIEP